MADKNRNTSDVIQDGLIKAFGVLEDSIMSKGRYDVTVIATVVDVTDKPKGIYRVLSDGVEFNAYSNTGTYYKNDSVLVQIPNGDYNNQKFILGRKSDESVADQVFNLKLPFDDFIGLMHLSKNQEIEEKGFWANYPVESQETPTETLIWEWKNIEYSLDEENNPGQKVLSTVGTTRLGIQADWQTLLGAYQPSRGHYGFRIVLKGVTSSSEAGASAEIVREGYFTNKDMYGNPYAFYAPYTQQKVFDTSEFLNIHSIEIYFYQDYDFADGDNVYITYDEYNEDGRPSDPPNILCSNLDIFLGVSAEDITEEAGLLYSYEALSYTGIEHKDDKGVSSWTCDEEHTLNFSWVHYEPNGTFSVIDNLEKLLEQRKNATRTHIYWYRYSYDKEIEENPDLLKFPGQTHKINEDGSFVYDENNEPVYEFVEGYEIYKNLYADLKDSKNNPAYESKMERYGGNNWTFIPALTDNFTYTLKPRGYKSREKIKVVIQHDGSHTTSDELILTNTMDIEAEFANNAKNDAIVIKCFRLAKEKDDEGKWNGSYEAIEDNSMNSFYIYDENNTILYNDDDERYDAHEYYLQIQVRNEDSNKYELLTTVVDGGGTVGTTVSWAFPRQLSMIKYSAAVTKEDAKYFGISENETLRYENFKNATIKFQIDSILNNRYLDNTVGATIYKNNNTYHISKELLFGRAEGLGHEYLPVIEILQPYGSPCIYYGQEFQIGCTLYNKDGSLFETPSILNFSWKVLSGKDTVSEFYHYDSEGNYLPGYEVGNYKSSVIEGDVYAEKYSKYSGNVIKGVLTNEYPPVFEVTVTGASDYPLTVRKGMMVYYDLNNGDWDYVRKRDFMIPNRVEFKSDGATPIYYNDYFEVAAITTNQDDKKNTYEVEYPTWEINNTEIFKLEESNVKREFIRDGESLDWSFKRYRMVPNTDRYEQDVSDFSLQWNDAYLLPEKYTYIYYKLNGQIRISQALAFDRNYYSSSLVNNWDGTSLTWNEEEGAILSTMIAAGSKDSYNRFTGVMMGDWSPKGDESLDTPGLYGYYGGAQTFGFKTDGTGFIGGSGKGRIEFDGNEALISNADRSCYINLNPVDVLTSNATDIDNQGFSQNFIYCRVPKTSNSFSDIMSGILGEGSWAKSYFSDNDNDYFIVDPNHGVLTTGGVVAKYGALGNWMISDQGLYQKAAGKYMYIGYNPEKANNPNSTDENTYAIYAGTEFGESNGAEPQGINPYFYVSWDGTFFARKGLIANTWTIDDTSLSYKVLSDSLTNKNIYDKIYIGKPESNPGKIESNDPNPENAHRWAISAGVSHISRDIDGSEIGEENSNINFGVSLSGELFAKLGKIAGWNFNNQEFYSDDEKMRILSTGYLYAGTPFKDADGNITGYPIMIDAKKGQLSVTNANGATSGYIYLGNFNLEAVSSEQWVIPTGFTVVPVTDSSKNKSYRFDNPNIDTNTTWGQTDSISIDPLSVNYTYSGTRADENTSTFTNTNSFKILSRDNNNLGIIISTGINQQNKKAVTIYPYNNDDTYATLGTTTQKWNIKGKIIDCEELKTAGALHAINIYANHEKVATEPWVYEQLKDVYDRLNAVGGGAGGAMSMTGGLGGVLSSLVTVQVKRDVVSDNGYMDLVGYNHEEAEIWRCKEIAATNHAHRLGFNGTKLNMGMTCSMFSSDSEIDLDHNHTITGSVNSSGVLSLSWGDTNFNSATGSSTIDLSTWLTTQIAQAFKSASIEAKLTVNDGAGGGDASAYAIAKLTFGGVTSSIISETVTGTWDCTSSHGASNSEKSICWVEGYHAGQRGDGLLTNPYK